MATIRKEILVHAAAGDVWAAVRDVGALHERLVPGFVVETKLEPGARVVTFANGMVARELIVTVDEEGRRLVWSVVGSPRMTHHNGALQVFPESEGTRIVWTADLLPDEIAPQISGMMDQGIAAMGRAFERG